MNDFQRQVLIGCCLGDISFNVFNTQKARIQMCQSVKYQEYLNHKYMIFKDLCSTPPVVKVNDKYPSIYFNTVLSEELYDFSKLFFNEGIRGVPQNIKDLLTPISLAFWFMDDGTSSYIAKRPRQLFRRATIMMCTDRYSISEVELLVDALNTKFGIDCHRVSSPSMNGRNRIYIGTKSAQKFFDIVEPYIPPIMRYKIKRPLKVK